MYISCVVPSPQKLSSGPLEEHRYSCYAPNNYLSLVEIRTLRLLDIEISLVFFGFRTIKFMDKPFIFGRCKESRNIWLRLLEILQIVWYCYLTKHFHTLCNSVSMLGNGKVLARCSGRFRFNSLSAK